MYNPGGTPRGRARALDFFRLLFSAATGGLGCTPLASAVALMMVRMHSVLLPALLVVSASVLRASASADPPTLAPKAFSFAPIADTKPLGWLQKQSRIQADTLGGHLEYFFVNNSLWMKDYKNLSEVPYPQKDLETVPCTNLPG